MLLEFNLQRAIKYYEDHEFEKALPIFEYFVLQGNPEAEYYLGKMYLNAFAVSLNYFIAMDLFKRSSSKGYSKAFTILGFLYYNGYWTPADLNEARKCYDEATKLGDLDGRVSLASLLIESGETKKGLKIIKKLARKGNGFALCSLGYFHYFGDYVKMNQKKAVKLYKKAWARGNINALNNIGVCYQNGRGIRRDYRKALECFELAASKGSGTAYYNLADMYESGKGVEVDEEKALQFLYLAAELNNPCAIEKLGDRYTPVDTSNLPRVFSPTVIPLDCVNN
ncbi:hypothetical protein TRFO_05378 [Tritrichomonas foetus]|uniref:Beta-lactamase n=1 Tax=Tritrichomonas foetus TaxID=1144522 RepID=A0A1J4K5I9_9EUKA|nr:hypothetical protein TRFO_05378 [Tritrichomonas foetus]|eukprot:OHT06721.1 hypothetical protein TRFO_05378 [Tritrichomonas foetus]